MLTNKIKFGFNVFANQHIKSFEKIKGQAIYYDSMLQEYDKMSQVYLNKRWTTKKEIYAKIHIIDENQNLKQELKQQKLIEFTKNFSEDYIKRQIQAEQINEYCIISLLCEDHFKQTLDEYLKKVIVNGLYFYICSSVPAMEDFENQQQIEDKCNKLMQVFQYGDQLSSFELDIEQRYLAQKQVKYRRYSKNQRPRFKCIWSYSDQKRLEGLVNWKNRELNQFDDFRPIFQNLNVQDKGKNALLYLQMTYSKWFGYLFYHLIEKKQFVQGRKRCDWIASSLLSRIMLYTNCIEKTHVLQLPPDFHIDHSILNIHCWLILDRLKKIDTYEAKYLSYSFNRTFELYTEQQVNKIHLKKKNDFVKDVNHFMRNIQQFLTQHFNVNENTKNNHYYKIDSLIWSIVFFEKVPRYSDQVYIASEYFLKQYEYIQSLSIDQILNGDIQFDVFRMDYDFKQKIISINPPLSQQEFESEINNDKTDKKYYYTYGEQSQSPLDMEINQKINHRFDNINIQIINILRKYQTLESYDYFSEKQQTLQDKDTKDKKQVWSNNEDRIDIQEGADYYKQKLKQKQNK